jgi:mono/diheme cytochrome c family protein
MRTRFALCLGLLALLGGLIRGGEASYSPDPAWRAPERAVFRPNPLATRPDATLGGRKLFLRHCSECHGEDGRGVKHHAADLRLQVVHRQTDGALFWKITNGNMDRGMPSFSRLPELQRWQLVLFIRTLKEPDRGGEEAPRPGR